MAANKSGPPGQSVKKPTAGPQDWSEGVEAKRVGIGWLGKFFGDSDHSRVYIAFILFLVVIGVIAILILKSSKTEDLIPDALKVFYGLASATLGYIFGSGGARSKP
jgi:hypothetical protein